MDTAWLIFFGLLGYCLGVPSRNSGTAWLFPETKQYAFDLKSNISTGSLLPAEGASYTTLQARLYVRVYDATRIQLQLDNLQSSVSTSADSGNGMASSSGWQHPSADSLLKPWEVIYILESGMVYDVRLPTNEPAWSANIKRAITVSLQLTKINSTEPMYSKSYTVMEPCLHDICRVEYSGVDTTTVRKYHGIPALTRGYGRNVWLSVGVDVCTRDIKKPFIGSAERVYQLDARGLQSFDLKSSLEYHLHNHILAVVTSMSLYRDEISTFIAGAKHDLSSTFPIYYAHSYQDQTNQRAPVTQDKLIQRIIEILTKISNNIDNENVTPNEEKIHNPDYLDLHDVLSQLNFDSLQYLYNDLSVGTSYLNETNKNLFREALPSIKSADSAKLIKKLVLDELQTDRGTTKFKYVELSNSLSLIRTLPFNIAEYSQDLLAHMEDLVNLPPDYPKEIRHASILSFATLAFHTFINQGCTADEFERYVQKYFKMYTECPEYSDRMVWLQGLSNLQVGSVGQYLGPVIQNKSSSRHERLLAILASMPLAKYTPELTSSMYWPIMTDASEHLQLRLSALLMLLQGDVTPDRILSLHRYISSSDDGHLKQFWYTTVRSLEKSSYSCFQSLSKLTSYVSNLVQSPGESFWASGNHIVDTSDPDRDYNAMVQLITMGNPMKGMPEVVHFTLNSNQAGISTNQISIMLKMEGWRLNSARPGSTLLHLVNETKRSVETHFEVIVFVKGKTVYATHFSGENVARELTDLIDQLHGLLKMDSHVNLQHLRYPLLTQFDLPTELGTPVTLKSLRSEFASIRGTTTTKGNSPLDAVPNDHIKQYFEKKNDLHFRYHGTTETTLASYDPLLNSRHTVKVQQTTVAHLPLKFHIKLENFMPTFTWQNEDRTGGLAMHARTQVLLDMGEGEDLHKYCPSCRSQFIVRVHGSEQVKSDDGYLFDCDRPFSAMELLEKLLDSNRANYEFFSWNRPSLLLVHLLYLVTVPPSGSCGVVVSSRFPLHLTPGTELRLQFVNANVETDRMGELLKEDDIVVGTDFGVVWADTHQRGNVYLKVNGTASLVSEYNTTDFRLEVSGEDFRAVDNKRSLWRYCFEWNEADKPKMSPIMQSLSAYPVPYEGSFAVRYDTGGNTRGQCKGVDGLMKFLYSVKYDVQSDQQIRRILEATIIGNENLKLSQSKLSKLEPFHTIVDKFSKDNYRMSLLVENQDSISKVKLDDQDWWVFRGSNIHYLMDNWYVQQLKRKFGFTRECVVEEETVRTLTGSVQPLWSSNCSETVLLIECDKNARFAIIKEKDDYLLYYESHIITIPVGGLPRPRISYNGNILEYPYNDGEDLRKLFKFQSMDNVLQVRIRKPSVDVYLFPHKLVLHVPDSYVDTVCGACLPTTKPYCSTRRG